MADRDVGWELQAFLRVAVPLGEPSRPVGLAGRSPDLGRL